MTLFLASHAETPLPIIVIQMFNYDISDVLTRNMTLFVASHAETPLPIIATQGDNLARDLALLHCDL